jgi:hypothetical protein
MFTYSFLDRTYPLVSLFLVLSLEEQFLQFLREIIDENELRLVFRVYFSLTSMEGNLDPLVTIMFIFLNDDLCRLHPYKAFQITTNKVFIFP